MIADEPRQEATGLRHLTSSSLKKMPEIDSRPVTRSGSRDGQVFALPPRPSTQQSQRLHTPGYEEMLNRRAKFERIVTPSQQGTRIDALKIGSQVSKSPSRMEVLKTLRQSPDVQRPIRTSSGIPQYSHSNNGPQQQSLQLNSVNDIKIEPERVALDDIAERVVKLLKERNYSTDKKVLDFLGTL